jgi:serine/threonine-protein kinase
MMTTPTTIGRYVDLQLLGQGGMGAVYRGRDPELDRPVAVKVMLDASPDFVARFRREAQSIAKLVHGNIVQVYDFGVDTDGNPYFVMELVNGRALDSIIRERGAMSPAEAIHMVRQAADGLGAAHAAGIIHRDVKPSNLIVDAKGTVKLVDFGIARVAAGGQALTGAAALLGTPGYMAPEQAAGKTVDARADIYALGLTLFELLAGQAPFQAEDAISLVVKNMQEPLPDLRLRGLGLPEELVTLVEQMSAKNPDQRLQSMTAVRAALDDVLTRVETGQWKAQHPSYAASSPSSLVPPTNVQGRPLPANTTTPDAAPPNRTPLYAAVGLLLAGGGVAAFLLLKPPSSDNKTPPPIDKPIAQIAKPGDVTPPSKDPGPTTNNAVDPKPATNTPPTTNAVVDRPGQGKKEGPLRVAVLKFKNLSKDDNLAMLEGGIGETALNELSGTKGVTLIERADIDSDIKEIDKAGDFHFDALTVAKLGQLKGIEYAVQGGVQKSGSTLRISARLVRVENGEVLDTLTVDHKGNPLDAETKVAKALLPKLKKLVEREGGTR